ncbi:hypothetical protein ACJZ2D_002138 [Fusarium nematophilum]
MVHLWIPFTASASLLRLAVCQAAPGEPMWNAQVETDLEATAWSLIYTYSMIFNAVIIKRIGTDAPPNEFPHVRDFPTPGSNSVVAPNMDVLYSFSTLDCSGSEVVLEIPEIDHGRFWSFVVWDLHGNAVGEISNVHGHRAGKYLILRDYKNPAGLSYSNRSGYRGIVRISTAYAFLAARGRHVLCLVDGLSGLAHGDDG